MAQRTLRTVTAAAGALVALAAVSANPNPPALPAPPPQPGAPAVPPPVPVSPGAPAGVPVPGPLVPITPTLPPMPALSVGPLVPITPTPPPPLPPPVPPPSPPPVQILEPFSSVHRFAGTYLGGDATRAAVYAEANGRAEVRHFSLTGAKEPLARCPVRPGQTAYADGRAFVLSARELVVVGADARTDWTFALPGRADNGERFVAVAGFDGANVLLASTQPLNNGHSVARLYTLEAASGRQVAFSKFDGGFADGAQFALDPVARTLVAAYEDVVGLYPLERSDNPTVVQIPQRRGPPHIEHGYLIVSSTAGVTSVHAEGKWNVSFQVVGTARPVVLANGDRTLVPAQRRSTMRHALYSFPVRDTSRDPQREPHWAVEVPKAITAAPVVRGTSVYFVAGSVLYRADAANGLVHWKHTLALRPDEALTGMGFFGDELRAWGGGVLVRVGDRGDPVPVPVAPAPRERARQVFRFGPGLFGSQ